MAKQNGKLCAVVRRIDELITQPKYDYTCSFDLQYEYYEQIDAPIKEFYVFHNSAHSPIFEELEVASKLGEEILEIE